MRLIRLLLAAIVGPKKGKKKMIPIRVVTRPASRTSYGVGG